MVYTYTVDNTGDDPLTDVTLDDDKCFVFFYLDGDANDNGTLDIDETWRFTCESTLDEDTSNVVRVDAEDSLGKAVIDETTAYVDVLDTDIDLRKSVDQPIIYVDGRVTYTIEVENIGLDPLYGVVVTDAYCTPVYVSGDSEPLDVLGVGEVWVYTCTMSLDEDRVNTASVTAEDGLGLPVGDMDAAEVNVIDPEIEVVKTASPAVALPGTPVTYTYTVRNPGDDPLSGTWW